MACRFYLTDMPSKAIKPKKPRTLKRVAPALARTQGNVARSSHKRQLEGIVGPFDTHIPIEAADVSKDGNSAVRVRPERTATTTNAQGDDIATADLLFWLDKGTAVRFATMPEGFENESSPNSTSTSSASYDRDEITVDSKAPKDGIEERNFMLLVGEENQSVYFRRMRQTFRSSVNDG